MVMGYMMKLNVIKPINALPDEPKERKPEHEHGNTGHKLWPPLEVSTQNYQKHAKKHKILVFK
jgi:hypothetical protein